VGGWDDEERVVDSSGKEKRPWSICGQSNLVRVTFRPMSVAGFNFFRIRRPQGGPYD
jgi:hypothetical protein